jgi:predicted nucleic acid-binding protein
VISLVDTSVILRKLFGERGMLAEWSSIREAFASRIVLVELGRIVGRSRLSGQIDDAQVEQLHGESRRLLRSISLVALTDRILTRAAGPMPTVLGSLDAIQLATAQELAASRPGLTLATHDKQLARAARASGLDVYGA